MPSGSTGHHQLRRTPNELTSAVSSVAGIRVVKPMSPVSSYGNSRPGLFKDPSTERATRQALSGFNEASLQINHQNIHSIGKTNTHFAVCSPRQGQGLSSQPREKNTTYCNRDTSVTTLHTSVLIVWTTATRRVPSRLLCAIHSIHVMLVIMPNKHF